MKQYAVLTYESVESYPFAFATRICKDLKDAKNMLRLYKNAYPEFYHRIRITGNN